MPIHDWTRVRANRFHHFHQDWTIEIARALNRGLLPDGFLALAEQITGGPEPDVVTLSMPNRPRSGEPSGLAIEETPPKTRFRTQSDAIVYARKANSVAIRHPDSDVVAVIEIVSSETRTAGTPSRLRVKQRASFIPGSTAYRRFVSKSARSQGIHKVIWDECDEQLLPADKRPRLLGWRADRCLRGTASRRRSARVAGLSLRPYVPVHWDDLPASWDAFPKELKASRRTAQ
jgi:hypothetical protein